MPAYLQLMGAEPGGSVPFRSVSGCAPSKLVSFRCSEQKAAKLFLALGRGSGDHDTKQIVLYPNWTIDLLGGEDIFLHFFFL